jgi:hypothetical protein
VPAVFAPVGPVRGYASATHEGSPAGCCALLNAPYPTPTPPLPPPPHAPVHFLFPSPSLSSFRVHSPPYPLLLHAVSPIPTSLLSFPRLLSLSRVAHLPAPHDSTARHPSCGFACNAHACFQFGFGVACPLIGLEDPARPRQADQRPGSHYHNSISASRAQHDHPAIHWSRERGATFHGEGGCTEARRGGHYTTRLHHMDIHTGL